MSCYDGFGSVIGLFVSAVTTGYKWGTAEQAKDRAEANLSIQKIEETQGAAIQTAQAQRDEKTRRANEAKVQEAIKTATIAALIIGGAAIAGKFIGRKR